MRAHKFPNGEPGRAADRRLVWLDRHGRASKLKHIFEIAIEVLTGDRQEDYGSPEENLSDIANGWTVIAKRALEREGCITATHVALMNDWQKTCRLLKTPAHKDSWVDKAGYTAIGYGLTKGKHDD